MSCALPKEADPESMDSFGIMTLAGIEGRNYWSVQEHLECSIQLFLKEDALVTVTHALIITHL